MKQKRKLLNLLKPAAPKYILMLVSGMMWLGVGVFLNTFAYQWIKADFDLFCLICIGLGMLLSFFTQKFMFNKVAKKNLDRIKAMIPKPCIFSFMSWQSYFLVMIMISLGISLRLSPIPKNYLSVIYIGIGLGLMISSFQYFTATYKEIRNIQ